MCSHKLSKVLALNTLQLCSSLSSLPTRLHGVIAPQDGSIIGTFEVAYMATILLADYKVIKYNQLDASIMVY